MVITLIRNLWKKIWHLIRTVSVRQMVKTLYYSKFFQKFFVKNYRWVFYVIGLVIFIAFISPWIITSNYLSILKDFAALEVSISSIVGGVIALRWYYLRRRGYPRANINLTVNHIQMGNKFVFVRVSVTLTNVGEIPLNLKDGSTTLYKVLPLEDVVNKTAIEGGKTPLIQGKTVIQWTIDKEEDERILEEPQKIILDPGEIQEINFDFIIPETLKVVIAYSYLQIEHKHDLDIGINKSSIYDMREDK